MNFIVANLNRNPNRNRNQIQVDLTNETESSENTIILYYWTVTSAARIITASPPLPLL